MEKATWFERAIFLSWYCSKADCKFCFMSTQKNKIKIKNPRLARRRTSSILAEVMITKVCGWKIEFLSGGYDTYTKLELLELIKKVHEIYNEKLWLNIGVLNKEDLKYFTPYIRGVCGAVETINPELHKYLCPSKPINDIERMFDACTGLNLEKSITIIIGLGETLNDFDLLKRFIKKHNLCRITFYALNPHKGTIFKTGPKSRYYESWVKKTREAFPSIEIIAGSWEDRLNEISLLLEAGADAITKFRAIRLFNSEHAKKIEEQAQKAGRKFEGTLTHLPKDKIFKLFNSAKLEEELKKRIKVKLDQYIRRMEK